MQHDHVLKKLNFDLLTQSVRLWGVYGQNICYHVAAFVTLFNLICTMTNHHIMKELNFDLLTPSPGSGVVCGQKNATMLLHL